MPIGDSVPLRQRIELGEAVIELVWAEIKQIDPNSWDTRNRLNALRGQLDGLLEEILPLYRAALEAVS